MNKENDHIYGSFWIEAVKIGVFKSKEVKLVAENNAATGEFVRISDPITVAIKQARKVITKN